MAYKPKVLLTADGGTGLSAPGTSGNILTSNGTIWTSAAPATSGTVTSVSGTANRITSTGGNTPVIDISASYLGQSSITTLGTISTGVWNGTAIGPTFGGTGQTTYATGDILYASALNTLSKLTAGSNTQILTLAGGVPTWAAPATSGTVTSVSGTTNRITSTGGATPVIDISASYVGQTSITTLGTITTGVWTGTNIALANGGTNATLTASNGGIFYSTATAGAILSGTATAGQMLRSGATAAPTWSTATFPSTATSTGTILRADGTNWVASTATYPNTAGTAGKVLVSDGTNFVSSTPTFPNASATSGKIIQSDGTNWLASTPTYPTTAGTSGKILVSDGTNIVSSTPTFPNASATTRKMIVSDGTNWVASTETWAVPGTSGNVLTSNGTNWTSAAPAAAVSFSAFVATVAANPVDATTYYLATSQSFTNFTSGSQITARVYIPVACTITKAYGAFSVAGTLGTSENCTVFLRLNNTTNTNISTTVQLTATEVAFNNAALSISCSAGDYLVWGFTGPTWVTNPTTVGFAAAFTT